MDPTVQFALVAVVAPGASYIQSVTGFGIFTMIFLPHLLLQTEANVLSTMLSMLPSLFTALLLFRRIHWKNLLFPCWDAVYPLRKQWHIISPFGLDIINNGKPLLYIISRRLYTLSQ